VWNVAHGYGKTATFMPKPLVGDNGNGMHVHQSLAKGGENLFAGVYIKCFLSFLLTSVCPKKGYANKIIKLT